MTTGKGTKQPPARRQGAAGRQTPEPRSAEPVVPAVPFAAVAKFDLDQMTVPELLALIHAARLKCDEKMAAAKDALIAEMAARAAGLGLTLSEIFPAYGTSPGTMVSKARRKQAGTPVAKYRDPATGQTWSGRGRQPLWLRDKDRDSFLIKGQGETDTGKNVAGETG